MLLEVGWAVDGLECAGCGYGSGVVVGCGIVIFAEDGAVDDGGRFAKPFTA